MSSAPDRLLVINSRTRVGRFIPPLVAAGCCLGIFALVRAVLDRVWPEGSAGSHDAIRQLALMAVLVCCLAAMSAIHARSSMRRTMQTVLAFVGRHGPIRRFDLLDACVPARSRPMVEFAIQQLLDNGRLDASPDGYATTALSDA